MCASPHFPTNTLGLQKRAPTLLESGELTGCLLPARPDLCPSVQSPSYSAPRDPQASGALTLLGAGGQVAGDPVVLHDDGPQRLQKISICSSSFLHVPSRLPAEEEDTQLRGEEPPTSLLTCPILAPLNCVSHFRTVISFFLSSFGCLGF